MSAYLNIKRIEFAVTYRCNSHCGHCHTGEEKRHAAPTVIDESLAVGVVRRVAEIYHPASVMTFGGEPLLYPDVVCAIHEAAKVSGVAERQIITNAGTPRSEARADDVAQRLAETGVNSIFISVDAFHQEHIPLQVVERNVRAYVDAGIPRREWNPCWVVSVEHDNPYNRRTLTILDALAHLPVAVNEDNVLEPLGNAQKWLSPYLPSKTAVPTGSCEDVPYAGRLDEIECISVEPNGGVSVSWDWIIGNAAERDILRILEGYDPYTIPEAGAVLQGGMAALVELCHARGVEFDPGGYYSICDACRSLRRARDRQDKERT